MKAIASWYGRGGKRVLDMILAGVGLVVVSPVALVVAVVVRIGLGCPVLFRQVRPGLHGRPFVMYKFRTMLDLRDENGECLPDEKRMTGVGKLLRGFSLDEIPELWNVLKGDMSAVGPRPLLMEYLPLYTPEQARRHDVRPGMAGPVIIRGRNSLDWEEKFTLDVWYRDHVSLVVDIKVLSLTALAVVRGKGVAQRGQATVSFFKGSKGSADMQG